GSSTIHSTGPLACSGSQRSPDVAHPPRLEPTYAAFTGAGSPFQHLIAMCPAHCNFSFASR
ncbi:jg22740, partial [Pararge aegeria aegeria]